MEFHWGSILGLFVFRVFFYHRRVAWLQFLSFGLLSAKTHCSFQNTAVGLKNTKLLKSKVCF